MPSDRPVILGSIVTFDDTHDPKDPKITVKKLEECRGAQGYFPRNFKRRLPEMPRTPAGEASPGKTSPKGTKTSPRGKTSPRTKTSPRMNQSRQVKPEEECMLKSFGKGYLKNYHGAYVSFLLLMILISSSFIFLFDDLSFLDSLYLAVSSCSMTGLTPVDLSSRSMLTQVIVWLTIMSTGPIFMSIVPVALRYALRREADSRGVAFYGLGKMVVEEEIALKFLLVAVIAYSVVIQTFGWILLWFTYYVTGNGNRCWDTLFLSTSAFHSAGFMTLPEGLSATNTPVLAVTLTLMLAGSIGFPVVLHLMLRMTQRLVGDKKTQEALNLLSRYPRRCYTHLFPTYRTLELLAMSACILIIQLAGFYFSNFTFAANETSETDLTWSQRLLAMCFLAVSSRSAGIRLNEAPFVQLNPSRTCIMLLSMWIASCPVVALMRATTWVEEEPTKDKTCSEERTKLRSQISAFMMQDLPMLIWLFFLIVLGQEQSTGINNNDFISMIFETISAYGSVGFSMSSSSSSISGQWSSMSKLSLLAVMLLGRVRSLPLPTERTVRWLSTEDPEFKNKQK
jgi:Trk-type K+ transport system membrane component